MSFQSSSENPLLEVLLYSRQYSAPLETCSAMRGQRQLPKETIGAAEVAAWFRCEVIEVETQFRIWYDMLRHCDICIYFCICLCFFLEQVLQRPERSNISIHIQQYPQGRKCTSRSLHKAGGKVLRCCCPGCHNCFSNILYHFDHFVFVLLCWVGSFHPFVGAVAEICPKFLCDSKGASRLSLGASFATTTFLKKRTNTNSILTDNNIH